MYSVVPHAIESTIRVIISVMSWASDGRDAVRSTWTLPPRARDIARAPGGITLRPELEADIWILGNIFSGELYPWPF
jgi:hypothetical protein